MTEVIQSSPSRFPSPSSSCEIPHQQQPPNSPTSEERDHQEEEIGDICDEGKEGEGERDEVSLIELLVTVFRRSMIGCSVSDFGGQELCSMEIGVPTDVRHVAHVTFDRFNGFLGLPVEFEPEVPRRAPSASTTVFGVSTESMQLSFDSRGNSVPTILLMMQRQLYARGGLQAEGVFRINAENSQEEYVRDQLNRGLIPDDIDVHCLAGLIKAWFRELPTGILDSLSQEQVMQAQSEEECVHLSRLLPPTEAALLDWAVNLMADVAQLEHLNKMNARNVAVVFAPNMTQMSDPLTALMYAVQVMNFLRTLIVRTLREREDSLIEPGPDSQTEPSDENDQQSSWEPSIPEDKEDESEINEEHKVFRTEEPSIDGSTTEGGFQNFLASIENIPGGNQALVDKCPCEVVSQVSVVKTENLEGGFTSKVERIKTRTRRSRSDQSSDHLGFGNGPKQLLVSAAEKNKGTAIVSSINPRTELFEAWR